MDSLRKLSPHTSVMSLSTCKQKALPQVPNSSKLDNIVCYHNFHKLTVFYSIPIVREKIPKYKKINNTQSITAETKLTL